MRRHLDRGGNSARPWRLSRHFVNLAVKSTCRLDVSVVMGLKVPSRFAAYVRTSARPFAANGREHSGVKCSPSVGSLNR